MMISESGWEGRSLEGKTAVIVNAWFGPGLATARLFANEGARIIVTASRQNHVNFAIDQIGENATGFVCEPVVAGQLAAHFRCWCPEGIDILCVFPTRGELAVAGQITAEVREKVMSRVGELFSIVQLALPFMNPNSALILSGPVAALDRNHCFAVNDAAYALEKQLVKTQVGLFADRNIRLNFLSFLDGPDSGNIDNSTRHLGEGRMGEAELIAANAMYLALPECRLNGLQVYMDGHCQTF